MHPVLTRAHACLVSCVASDMDDDDEIINPDDLPRRILTDFAIYKDDGAAACNLHAPAGSVN